MVSYYLIMLDISLIIIIFLAHNVDLDATSDDDDDDDDMTAAAEDDLMEADTVDLNASEHGKLLINVKLCVFSYYHTLVFIRSQCQQQR